MSLRVHSPGLFTTIQDLGRHKAAHLGVSPAGAADTLSLRVGNRLVGNSESAAALELTLTGGKYELLTHAVVALTGAQFDANIPLWTATSLNAGAIIQIGGAKSGARGYLCIRGGIDGAKILGSQSTHILSGFGTPIKKLEELPIGSDVEGPIKTALVTPPKTNNKLRITAGAQAAQFDALQLMTLLTETYGVSDDSNRMGLRLIGPALNPPFQGQMLSEGVALGAIQVPSSGHPIILFVDAQTTGGYPVLASIISADLPSVGQLRPRDEVTFEAVTMAEALRALKDQEDFIRAI